MTGFVVESTFYFMDAINFNSKVREETLSFSKMVTEIYKKEGIYGFFKGYSVSFYASILYGLVYFTLYKLLKNILEPLFWENSSLLYISSSIIANFISLGVYYPFILIKTRWLSSNEKYKYTSLSEALKKLL